MLDYTADIRLLAAGTRVPCASCNAGDWRHGNFICANQLSHGAVTAMGVDVAKVSIIRDHVGIIRHQGAGFAVAVLRGAVAEDDQRGGGQQPRLKRRGVITWDYLELRARHNEAGTCGDRRHILSGGGGGSSAPLGHRRGRAHWPLAFVFWGIASQIYKVASMSMFD